MCGGIPVLFFFFGLNAGKANRLYVSTAYRLRFMHNNNVPVIIISQDHSPHLYLIQVQNCIIGIITTPIIGNVLVTLHTINKTIGPLCYVRRNFSQELKKTLKLNRDII